MRRKKSLSACPKQTKSACEGGRDKSTRGRTKTPQRACDEEKEEGTREHEQAQNKKELTPLRRKPENMLVHVCLPQKTATCARSD